MIHPEIYGNRLFFIHIYEDSNFILQYLQVQDDFMIFLVPVNISVGFKSELLMQPDAGCIIFPDLIQDNPAPILGCVLYQQGEGF